MILMNKIFKNEALQYASLPYLLLILTFLVNPSLAQESLNTSGGNALGIGGSASYSVGQTVYTNDTANGFSIANGVQQPYEISEIVGFEKADSISLALAIYPNPANEYLILEVKEFNLSNISFQLIDISGKLIITQKINSIQSIVDMSQLSPAIYFITIFCENMELKKFKIIKQ